MIAILDSVDGYSDRTIAFVEVTDECEARCLLAAARALFGYPWSQDSARIIGVTEGIDWWSGKPTSVDELLTYGDVSEFGVTEHDRYARLDEVPAAFLDRIEAAQEYPLSAEWKAYAAKRREEATR